ncbi:MAG: aminotransferase class IV [Limisphaerales bacterium]
MEVFLNGAFVPACEARVSVFDRSFLYGDGLFETIRCYDGLPFAWAQHLDRLHAGAEFLRLRLPFSDEALLAAALEVLRRHGLSGAMVRLHVSRGVGRRGYSPAGAEEPGVIITAHPAPEVSPERPLKWRLATSPFRVPAGDPLAPFKTGSRLLNVLARQRAEEAGTDEALLLDTAGHVAEAASGNVFWHADGAWHTPPPATGALAGVTRRVLLEALAAAGRPCHESCAGPEALLAADAVVVTSSGVEVARAVSLDGRPLAPGGASDALHRLHRDCVRAALGRRFSVGTGGRTF